MSELNANAKKWIEALRSGRYQQARHRLTDGVGYCCLGVACLVAEESGIHFHDWRIGKVLPPKVADWLGLSSNNGSYALGYHSTALTNRNDDGETFSEIANIIESQPEGLFRVTQRSESSDQPK